MTPKEFASIAISIPTQPGIYKYFNAAHQLIYVGKAKHLRKRVSSYFTKTLTNYKTQELVQHIYRIEFTIVNSEQDAFLLENSLIKEHQPKYNINLKDDKTYPYIVIKKEPFPRVFFTRRKINDGSTYFGPYTSVVKVKELLDFIKENILLRTCTLNLTENNIKKQKFKVCLEYHLGNCKGPCQGFQTAYEYNEELEQLTHLLKGNLHSVIQHFKKEMKAFAQNLDFEKALVYKKKIEHLQNYQATSTVVNTKIGTVDVFSILQENNIAYINYLAVAHGTLIHTQTIILEKKLEETAEEILCFGIAQLRNTFNSQATEIIVPFAINYPQENTKIIVPKLGDKKKLLALSEKNVNYFKEDLKQKKMLHLEDKTTPEKLQVLHQLQKDLYLQLLPTVIECFDNSNFQGSFPVSAMVCFINGQPAKAEYRTYKVKTVEAINDFASMAEVVYRRYKRLLEEKKTLPQLVIIDGGKGQLSAALQSVSSLKEVYAAQGLQVLNNTTFIGLAKNEEEIFFAGDTQSLKLPWDSESLKLIRRIRDEVHNHGISFHRNLRSKGVFTNELEQVKGIGKVTAHLLLKEFKSVKNIKLKTKEELENKIGKAKTKILIEHFLNQP